MAKKGISEVKFRLNVGLEGISSSEVFSAVKKPQNALGLLSFGLKVKLFRLEIYSSFSSSIAPRVNSSPARNSALVGALPTSSVNSAIA